MERTLSDITYLILGGFIAAASNYFVIWRGERKNLSLRKKLLITGLRDDLNRSISLYEKINDSFEKNGTIWLEYINDLRESREIYKNNKDWIILFNDDTRNRIYLYYQHSNNLLNSLEHYQKKYTK